MQNDKKHILAVDLGTTGPKVALFSAQGELIGYDYEKTQVHLLPGGGAEQSTAEWWEAIKSATRRLLSQKLVATDSIAALCCTTQWSGTVAVDERGEALANAIIWMDSRGAPYVREITRGPVAVEGFGIGKLIRWVRLTGGVPGHAGKDPIAHILYLKHEQPEIYRQAYKFLEPKDYLNLRFTGRFAASYDSITLHWLTDNRDLSRVRYDRRLLEMSTVERGKFPDLQRAVDLLGTIKPDVAAELGLHPNVQVVTGTPDVHSAALGSGAVPDFEPHLYIGTSSWIACHVPFKKTSVMHQIGAVPSAIPQKYLVIGEQETSGACLNFFRDNVLYHQDELPTGTAPADTYEILGRMAGRIPAGSGRLIFTPWLYGERTPVDDSTVRGGLHNLSLETTRGHIIRAILEGVAYNMRWLLLHVEKLVGRRFDALNIIGGGANSSLWCQIFADVLDRTIRQVSDPILANARGAAFLASVALGTMAFGDIPERISIAHTYTPDPKNRETYEELFREFLNINKSNRRIYARLNRGA